MTQLSDPEFQEWLNAVERKERIPSSLPADDVADLQFVLNDASVKYVFVNDAELLQKVTTVRANTPTVKDVFSFEQIEGCFYFK